MLDMRDGHLKRLRIPIGLILHILMIAGHRIIVGTIHT